MIPFLSKISGNKNIFPLYHLISDNPPVHVRHLFRFIKNSKQFSSDLIFFLKYYRALPVEELTRKKIGKSSFMITFDDGFSEIYNTAAPILSEKKCNAVIFINPAFTDNKDLFYRCKASLLVEMLEQSDYSEKIITAAKDILKKKQLSKRETKYFLLKITYQNRHILDKIALAADYDFGQYLKEKKPYMTTAQLKELADAGFLIGAHGIDHPYFPATDYAEQIRQVKESIHFVTAHFNPPLKVFAFPFSDFGVSDRLYHEITENHLANITFGTAGIKDDTIRNSFQRIPMEKNSVNARVRMIREYSVYLIKKLTGKSRYNHTES